MLSVILAYRRDNGIRDEHLRWTLARYDAIFSAWKRDSEVVLVEDDSGETGWGTFNKSALLNEGVRQSSGDVLLITDIDAVLSGVAIARGMELAKSASLVFPYDRVVFLEEHQTRAVLANAPDRAMPHLTGRNRVSYKERLNPYGTQMISRANYYKAGGYDERFVGWGSEDTAFIFAAASLCDGDVFRMSGPLVHLWHPADPDRQAKRDAGPNAKYAGQYKRRILDADLMREVIERRKQPWPLATIPTGESGR